jgi:6-phosphogluconolactonase
MARDAAEGRMSEIDYVYVGTYSEAIRFGTGQVLQGRGKGIHVFRFDRVSGRLTPAGVAEGVRNPSYLAFDPSRRFLYCVNEFKEYEGKASGAASGFRIDRASGALTALGTQASHGTDPCHLMVDRGGRNVLLANFASGSVAVLPIGADGALAPASDVVQHAGSSVDPVRQAGPHAHAVEIDAAGRFAMVPELGLDRVMIYELDAEAGRLRPNARQPWIATAPGAGPRQIVMHPGGRFAYLINELDSTMTAYAFDAAAGTLAALQTLSTLPAGFAGRSTCAELQIHPTGRFLYGSNRGHDSVAVFALDPATGRMEARGHVGTGGRIPRNFCLSPDGRFLAAANQDSDNVVMFAIDQATGMPASTGHEVAVGTPVGVRFL